MEAVAGDSLVAYSNLVEVGDLADQVVVVHVGQEEVHCPWVEASLVALVLQAVEAEVLAFQEEEEALLGQVVVQDVALVDPEVQKVVGHWVSYQEASDYSLVDMELEALVMGEGPLVPQVVELGHYIVQEGPDQTFDCSAACHVVDPSPSAGCDSCWSFFFQTVVRHCHMKQIQKSFH